MKCAFCGKPWYPGGHSILSPPPMTCPTLPLCDYCYSQAGPTVEQIWNYVKSRDPLAVELERANEEVRVLR